MKILTDATLNDHIDEPAAFEPNRFPAVSLYLDTRPDQHGRDDFDSFVREEFRARAKALPPRLARACEFQTRRRTHHALPAE